MTIFRLRKLTFGLALSAGFAMTATAAPRDELAGSWCFYEQEDGGRKAAEKVDIAFLADGNYVWQEGAFQQNGRWALSGNVLEMSNVGKHTVIQLGGSEMELKRGSTMRFKKEKCSTSTFGDQDITQFHNAASTGDMAALDQSIGKGIGVNITDLNRGDTALIKAAKFCQIPAAQRLLASGADRAVKNEDGKTAIDYARSSSFHKGCDALVKLL